TGDGVAVPSDTVRSCRRRRQKSYDDVIALKETIEDSANSEEEDNESESEDDVCVDEDNNIDSMFDENDIDVTDNQDFDSDFGKESDLERIRISKLSQLRKRKLQEDSVMNKHDLFIGQSFGSSTHIKDRVYMHSIETRRKLKLIRNGKRRVRAKCVGQMPIFDLNDNGLCKDGPSNQSASHSKGTTTRSRACANGKNNSDIDKGKGIINGGKKCP
ncbi:hypothetical protein Tco_1199752, partial [Tanacetum coccineum]